MTALVPSAVEPFKRGRFGNPYIYQPVCTSTQLLLEADIPEGAVAVAEHQTAGRGRLGRIWEDVPGSSILLSVMLHPPLGRMLPQLSLIGGIATARAIEAVTGLPTSIKWPNDVILDDRKVAGVLAEARDNAVVLGIGINVNETDEELPRTSGMPAGSLRTATGTRFDRAPLLGALLAELEHAYDTWHENGLAHMRAELTRRDYLRGRLIALDGKDTKALQIAADGRLEVESAPGDRRLVQSGEIRLLT